MIEFRRRPVEFLSGFEKARSQNVKANQKRQTPCLERVSFSKFFTSFFIPKSEGADAGTPYYNAQSIQNSQAEFCRRSQRNHREHGYAPDPSPSQHPQHSEIGGPRS